MSFSILHMTRFSDFDGLKRIPDVQQMMLAFSEIIPCQGEQ